MGRLIYSAICSLDGYVTDRDGTFDWAEPDVWADADKVVYSSTLETVATRRTRLEREFDATGVRRMKDDATRDLSIGRMTSGSGSSWSNRTPSTVVWSSCAISS